MSANTINTVSPVAAVVSTMLAFAEGQDLLTELSSKLITLRSEMIAQFKTLPLDWTWASIKNEVKQAVEGSPIKDKIGALGALKTAFEYKILPTTLNADRLRKMPKWSSWEGKTIENCYGKVHTKLGAGQKAKPPVSTPTTPNLPGTGTESKTPAQTPVAPTTTAPIVPQTPAKGAEKPVAPKTPESGATVAPPAKAGPSVPPSEVKPLTANVNSEDTLSPFEHWETLCHQFINHGVTAHYISGLAVILNVEPKALALAMVQARKDLLAKANRELTKK